MMRVASLPPDTIGPRGPKANERHRLPPLASLAPHPPRPARDAAHVLERGGVVCRPCRVHTGARAAE